MSDSLIISELEGLTLEDDQAAQLFRGYQNLLTEVDKFNEFLKEKNREDKVELRHFKNHIQQDLKGVSKLLKSQPPEKHRHILSSSNLSFFQAVWNFAKRCSGVTYFLKKRGQGIIADIIADGGLQWVKVSTISERRLLFDMARQGWDWDEPSDEEDDLQKDTEEESSDISLVKTATKLMSAAKTSRVKYKHPSVTIVLPRITSGKISHVDAVLDNIRAQGAHVICANDLTTPPTLEEAIPNMIYDEYSSFSSTVNIDCTILLALVSDISHAKEISEAGWFNKAVIRQLEIEKKEKLMPAVLWPAMAGRRLVCTREAATRMKEITEFIGTDTEKGRMRLLLDDSEASAEQLREQFAELSCHAIPNNWQLPISVCDKVALDDERLPLNAREVAGILTDMNQSVFLFGWANGFTTISSNRSAAKAIETVVEENRVGDNETGPDIWVSWTSRSLVAKEKDRRGF